MTDTIVFVRAAFGSRAAELTDALSAAGIDATLVIVDGKNAAVDSRAAAKARCNVLCWSSNFDRDHDSQAAEEISEFEKIATASRKAENFIHVRVDVKAEQIPQSYDYITPIGGKFVRWWRGLFDGLYTRDIIGAVRNRRAKIYPPEPMARRRMIQRQLVMGIIASGGMLATASGVLGLGQFIPWPRWNEERAWAAVKNGDCVAMKAFVAEYPDGRHSSRANASLLRPEQRLRWVIRDRPAELSGPLASGIGHTDQATAELTSLNWARGESKKLCENYANNLDAKLIEFTVPPSPPQCQAIGGRWFCQIDGTALCRLSEPEPQAFCTKAER
jgi:hypothetical protein